MEPLHFILYINGLPGYVNPLKSVLYADDTITADEMFDNLFRKVKGILINLNMWIKVNKLSFNLDKLVQLLADARSRTIHTFWADAPFLGLRIGDKLKCNYHIDLLTGKPNSPCYISTMKMIYFAF